MVYPSMPRQLHKSNCRSLVFFCIMPLNLDKVHVYTCISASKRLAVRGPESSLMPPTPVSETTGEALGVLMVREDSEGEKVGVIAEGVSPVFLTKGEYTYLR